MKNLDNKVPTQKKRAAILIAVAALLAVLVVASTFLLQSRTMRTAAKSSSPQNNATVSVQATPKVGAVTVEVTLSEFKITSSITNFKVGTPYYFVVTNKGHSLHEFLIMPDKPNGSNYLVNGEYSGPAVVGQEIEPGASLTVNYVFSPAATTHYEIACLMRGHYAAGMSRPIVVTKS